MNAFLSADILLPKKEAISNWPVIACDQFTSDPGYWNEVKRLTENLPSAYHLILPEVELGTPREESHTLKIHENMERYLQEGIFETYENSYIYVERTLENGMLRRGLVGRIDLEQYDYNAGATSEIRATERTVLERIPPRVRIRKDAVLELPHVLLLCDDDGKCLIEPVAAKKDSFPKLYDMDLMQGGGHVAGWLVSGKDAEAFNDVLTAYCDTVDKKYEGLPGIPMTFAVGDGNHSLATAKACYEALKAQGVDVANHPARYALVELENLHDPSLVFEPIHRVVFDTHPEAILKALEDWCAPDGFPVHWYTEGAQGTIYLDKARHELAVGVLQGFLDEYLAAHPGKIDYIHDDDALIRHAKRADSIGFLLPTMEKSQLFRGVIADGVLPRKTFSMGHSREKRYYMEARRIVK